MEIIHRTPVWVWVIFALLVWLGLRARKTRLVPWRMPIIVPLAMTVMAVAAILTRYQDTNLLVTSLLAWVGVSASLAVFLSHRTLPEGFYYDAESRRFGMPGSWWPLVLYTGIFAVKFAVGVLTATHVELTQEWGFVLIVSAIYGLFSGRFLANAWHLMRLKKESE